jgi:Polyketide cyclase / dehydrase and lipid transport
MIFLYVFFGFIAAMLLLSLILPAKYNVQQSTTINAPVTKVFDHVANLNNYRNWNPWQRLDPTATSDISGTPKTIGHKYNWYGKKIGMGSLTLRGIAENKNIDFALEFIKPWKSKADDSWIFEETTDGTKATWRNSGGLPWPMARLMGPMISKQLNHQFLQGLKNLKEACEA